jgi:phosphoribosylformimino-5-aminoimidazole carboxamide ribotide isomerase
MQIFPAVDILDGQCVQLVQGKRESATRFGDPLSCARRWLDEGATSLHVINLDGAFGSSGKNADLIRGLVEETRVFIELGGGIRSEEDAAAWLGLGVNRVILGTMAAKDPEIIKRLAGEWGSERIMAGVDAKADRIAIEGWQKTLGDYLTWAERFEKLGAGSLLYTNVDIEGLEQGVRLAPVKSLIERVGIPVVVAGGVSGREDVAGLRDAGAAGAVLGSALYSGKISLKDALEVCR